jgi:hypothetical protein
MPFRLSQVACCFVICGLLAARTATAIDPPPDTSRWIDSRQAGQFVCRADFALSGYEGLFPQLEQIQADLVRSLGIPAPHEQVELYLLHDQATYRQYLHTRYPQVPDRRALFVKGRGPGQVYAYRSDQLPTDVRHEGTHGLLHASLPTVPLWLDEGLAEFFEVPPERRAYDNPHLSELKWNLRLSGAPHLKPLEMKTDVSEMTAADYRHAWAWVHFMLYGSKDAHAELVRYMADLHAGKPAGQLSHRLERHVPDCEQRLVKHFKNWKR